MKSYRRRKRFVKILIERFRLTTFVQSSRKHDRAADELEHPVCAPRR